MVDRCTKILLIFEDTTARKRMVQPYNIADKDALLALQRISTASSITQIPMVLSASVSNIRHGELDKDKIVSLS